MSVRRAAKLLNSILLACWVVGCASQPLVSSDLPKNLATKAPYTTSSVPVLIVEGNGDAMGRLAGQNLGPQIEQLHSAYMAALFQDPLSRELALKNAQAYEPFIDPEHLAEIRGLSETSGLDYNQALLSQCFLDILPMVACSTIALPADASPDGVARMGRNLDFPSMGVADKASMILIYKPQNRYHFAAITWPGLVGALTGMNEHGLVVANMEVTRLPAPAKAMPYVLLYRSVLEKCKNVDEAIALLESSGKQTANNLMLMDAQGGRAVVEINPPGLKVRKGLPGEALLSTNHQRGENHDKPNRCNRYDRMLKLSRENFGQMDEAKLRGIVQSVSVSRFTLQSMVFEPVNRVIYLSTGESAGNGPYHRLDLGALMK